MDIHAGRVLKCPYAKYGLPFETGITSTIGSSVSSLVETSQVVLEKKRRFLNAVKVFILFRSS